MRLFVSVLGRSNEHRSIWSYGILKAHITSSYMRLVVTSANMKRELRAAVASLLRDSDIRLQRPLHSRQASRGEFSYPAWCMAHPCLAGSIVKQSLLPAPVNDHRNLSRLAISCERTMTFADFAGIRKILRLARSIVRPRVLESLTFALRSLIESSQRCRLASLYVRSCRLTVSVNFFARAPLILLNVDSSTDEGCYGPCPRAHCRTTDKFVRMND